MKSALHGRGLVRWVFTACILLMALAADAQPSYPARPVRIVVPSSAGGGTDTTTRLVASKLSESLGQRVIVENRPGAASIIGSEIVARSAPDGYTLKDPVVRENFQASGADPVGNTPDEFAAVIRADLAKWGKVVKAAGITPQ